DMDVISRRVFEIAECWLPTEEVMDYIHKWIQEDKLSFLITVLEDKETSLAELQDAIARYQHLKIKKENLSPYSQLNLKVLLIQRLFTSQLEFIRIAKNYIRIEDFYDVLQHTISPKNSHGRLGGKSTGLFFAHNIIKSETDIEFQKKIKTPKSWYITSDAMQSFIHYNNLEEVVEQKYKEIEQIRAEYPNIVQMYKNSYFPHDIAKELGQALDSFGDSPIIVRSSSLLEDSFGTSFSGKYKSLFLANQGSKVERLDALMDAIAEVYASVVGPDPIEYRKEHGLVDYHEEMAIMIQEVVGTRVGKYFFPAFAGVAFSNNEFRWSPRIKRNDGLVRLVPGLGTRAVDRLSDDYPVLASPGQPGIRVNASPDEVLKYSPKNMDVINLEDNIFETLSVSEVLEHCKDEFPMLNRIFSVNENGFIHQKAVFNIDFEQDDLIVTFRSLITDTTFMKRMKTILNVLEEKMGTPVDMEFAVKDDDIYLLQCRPQCFTSDVEPAPIPQDIPEKDILFTAHKHISNGRIPEVTHIVYVDPAKYYQLTTLDELKLIGRCVGQLNSILPKKKFILIGPGRWGSKGDIKLGVDVSYSEISNISALVEVAKEQGNFAPDLSFGTHFFQDLVESTIRYIPLYPDESKNVFNTKFFEKSKNILSTLLPKYQKIQDCVKVIDVPAETDGNVLKIFMNADLEQAIGYIGVATNTREVSNKPHYEDEHTDNYWLWRMQMSEHLASQLDAKKYGVVNLYIFGSVKNATAGPGSDIDLLVHFRGNEIKKSQLLAWFEGWSKALARMNYLKTGYKSDGLIDLHLITDEDIANKSSFAIKIGAVTDAAKQLTLRK
ncbi:MAG: nucleotidyltransferase domain-containing protein, partial [Candidatus Cloacimonetes bacterium]|nr:nucleotidyltransferase domain-containing protein [Candidatus Cloacimonadota bacterium]